MCVCVCVCVCVRACVRALVEREREQPWTNSMWHFRIQPGRERTRGVFFGLWHHPCWVSFISTYWYLGVQLGVGEGGLWHKNVSEKQWRRGEGGNSVRPAIVLQISLLSVFFWYGMEVPDPNLGGIVQYVTRRIPRVCLYCFSFSNYTFSIQRWLFISWTVWSIHTRGSYSGRLALGSPPRILGVE